MPARRFPAACTIVSRNYLSDARVLAASYLEHHAGARFFVLVIDDLPDGVEAGAGIQVIRSEELDLPFLPELYFKCNATELCITVKPALLNLLLTRYNEPEVIYFDSDILVTRRLEELVDVFGTGADIVLTPHLLRPLPLDGKRPNEQDILIAGSYNLGFIAVRRSEVTHAFLHWWQERMRGGCFIQFSGGLLTDQKWVDLAPGLFGATALRDETYNVAYWNLHSRATQRRDDTFWVNGRPLAFFHFSGFDPAVPSVLSEHQNRIELEVGDGLSDLLAMYVELQKRHGFGTTRAWKYRFGWFDNNGAIGAPMRRLYINLSDAERRSFGDPFRTAGNSFFAWATRPDPNRGGLSPFLRSIYELREDVAAVFPDVAGTDREAFVEWAATEGAVELRYDPVVMRVNDCAEHPVRVPAIAQATSASGDSGPRCSIIVPVFNNASLTRNCLDSIFQAAAEEINFDVIVADDASTDTTPEILESYEGRIRVVRHAVNTGFAQSCNDAAEIARGEYLIFLNNDTVGRPGWLDALVRYADTHPEAAIVGARLLFPNETVQHAGIAICQDFEPRHLYNGFPSDHPLVNRSRKFQAVTGACLLVRRADFDRAGGFDAAYRNGYEDVDLCLRLGESGREVHYCHESVLYHLEAISRNVKADDPHNRTIFFDRWAGRLRPDELQFYAEDQLLRVEHRPVYPIGFSISPLLGIVSSGEREFHVDRLLESRSQQVLALLKDTIRLNLQVQELELRGNAQQNGPAALPRVHAMRTEPPREVSSGRIHRFSTHSTERLVSIILPVKDGAAKLGRLLEAVLSQKTDDCVEIVAVDSASRDESVQILREAGAKVIAIDPRTFNHGLTRNLAATYARGSFFVFLNQSTIPANQEWLANLLRPFDSDEALAGVCGRMLPREDADLLTARETQMNINARTERITTRITDWDQYRSLDAGHLRLFVNFHSLSAAVRKEVFRRIPFREANFAEDLIWGKEVLEAGYRIQYEPSAVAYHSHNYSFLDTFRRNFDDGIACAKIIGMESADADVAPSIAHLVREDWRYLETDCQLSPGELESWRLNAAMRRAAQITGHWLGVNFERSGGRLLPLLSITEQIKAGAKTESSEGWRACHAAAIG